MLKQPIYYEFNLDARTSPSKLIAISHVDDKYSEVLEVAVKQNDRFVYMGGATVVARMVLHREKDYLLSDSVPCTVYARNGTLISVHTAPNVNLTVNYRPALDEMSAVGLGDTVDVMLKGGRTVEAKITKTVFDSLSERWTSIELGKEKLMLSKYIAKTR